MGKKPTEPQLLPLLAFSLPRSFSSMSDITGKGPWGLCGEGSSGGSPLGSLEASATWSPVSLRPLPEVLLCPAQESSRGVGSP